MTEKQLKLKIKTFLKEQSETWFFMPVMNGYGRNGIPDFVGCCRGHFFSIETKAKGETATPWQKIEASQIIAAQGRHLQCDSFELFTEWWRIRVAV
jgi:hypothetical protein